MKKIKLYNWETTLDFGKYKGRSIMEVFDKNPDYVKWCLKNVDWFCITDEIFDKLPIDYDPNILWEKLNNNYETNMEQEHTKSEEDSLREKHNDKKERLLRQELSSDIIDEDYYEDSNIYMSRNPNHDNPWIDVFGAGEEADTAYWNTQ